MHSIPLLLNSLALCLLSSSAVAAPAASAASRSPIAGGEEAPGNLRVLILDGQNNHNWRNTTIATKAALLASGRFDVDVATSPADKKDKAAWEAWLPEFSKYDVLLSNYNDGGRCVWSERFKTAFSDYIKGGGGLVVVHAADNSSGDWPEYNRMIAVGGWGGRTPQHGSHLRMTDGAWGTDPAPKQGSGSHGPQHEFVIEAHEPEHPILRGLPAKWKHGKDELYDSLRGPCENVKVLASTWCPKTKRNEPMIMTIAYGTGRVFHTPMGHVGGNDPVHCVGFQTILARGTEWAASGKVTLGIPAGFPTAEKVSIIAPADVDWSGAHAGGKDKTPSISLLGKGGAGDALAKFVFSDSAVWRAGATDGRNWIEHFGRSKYSPPVRSPVNISLLADSKLGSFKLEADLQQTGKEYGHRDMCLFFGYQDQSHYYYAHIATKTDDHAHNIFIVNGEARKKISTHTTAGHDWSSQDWHNVRLERDVKSGLINIFVNDMEKPIMSAKDATFGKGYVGFGSFDDTGRISNVRIWSEDVEQSRIAAQAIPASKGK